MDAPAVNALLYYSMFVNRPIGLYIGLYVEVARSLLEGSSRTRGGARDPFQLRHLNQPVVSTPR